MKSMLKNDSRIFLEKQDINKLISKLAADIKYAGIKYEYVVGIARGGLNISKPLARKLKVKHKQIRISFYHDNIQTGYPSLIDVTSLTRLPKINKILIVDDLIDAGHTMAWLRDNVSEYMKYDTAVAYWNQHNRYGLYPTYYGELKPEGWIVFPWEKNS
jgi:hypoxanthine phosphoribosyltransferase